MPMFASSVAITTSQQPSSAALPAKRVAAGDADQRRVAAEPGEEVERLDVEAGDDRPVDVAGPPAAALGEQHDRQPPPLGQLEQPVVLEVPAHALRAREHRVVVGHDDDGRAVDLGEPADDAVGGRAREQLLLRPPPFLRGEDQRLVLDEAALVDEVGDVLARGPPALLAPPRDRVGARGVEPGRVARDDVVERAAARGVPRGPPRLAARRRGSAARSPPPRLAARRRLAARGRRRHRLSLRDRVAHRHVDADHFAAGLGEHLVLHLHRLDRRHDLAGRDRSPGAATATTVPATGATSSVIRRS